MIGLLGSGSWATALMKILTEKEHIKPYWWVRESEIVEGLLSENHNPLYLSEAHIEAQNIHITRNLSDVVENSDDIFIVIPSAFVARTLSKLPVGAMVNKRFHIATKGLIPETNQIVSDYLNSRFDVPYEQMCAVCGPSHAEETARQKLTYLTVASPNETLASNVRAMLECNYVRTTYSADMQGIEYATMMKNIYAIAAGMCHGLGYGDNLVAVLISSAMREMDDFIQRVAPIDSRQLEQFAYLGDLLVTCYSQHSRNRTLGNIIGHGYRVEDCLLEMNMVAEGYYAVNCLHKMKADMQIQMPIVDAVYNVLYGEMPVDKEIKQLVEHLA